MVANILHADPFPPPSPTPPTMGMGSIGQNSIFSGHGHVTYKIKGNHEIQHYDSIHFAHRPLPLFPDPWKVSTGQKGQNSTFLEHGHVAYQIYWIQVM